MLPDYITVTSSMTAVVPPLCRNCRFWGDKDLFCDHPLNFSREEGGFDLSLAPPYFGCVHFEVKDGNE